MNDLAPATRTSSLAVASLVLSLICCIPGPGAIGALLGVGGVVSISRSNGRLKGMGLAVTGVVLGLLFTLLWIAIALAFVGAMSEVAKFATPFAAIESGDRQTLTSWLTPSVQPELTDERVEAFRQAYQKDYGAFVGVPTAPFDVLKLYAALGQGIPGAQQEAARVGYSELIPIPAEFASGNAVILYPPDSSAMGPAARPAARNLGFIAADGSIVWLLEPSGGP